MLLSEQAILKSHHLGIESINENNFLPITNRYKIIFIVHYSSDVLVEFLLKKTDKRENKNTRKGSFSL